MASSFWYCTPSCPVEEAEVEANEVASTKDEDEAVDAVVTGDEAEEGKPGGGRCDLGLIDGSKFQKSTV